jgi:iron complex outermembrane receptor protein
LNTSWQGQRWTTGIEYKGNTRQSQKNEDVGYGCYGFTDTACLDDRRKSRQFSFYAQNEITIGESTYLTLGLRHDRQSDMPGHWSPRLGLVHQNDSGGIFKFLYATAFSDPTVYQRFYTTPTYAVGNPDLVPERMRSIDLSWEQRLGARTRLTSSLYIFRIQDLLGLDAATGLSANLPDVIGRGMELELQHRWLNSAALRIGYTLQQPSTVSTYIENVARHSLRGNFSFPVFSTQWLAGVEGQVFSRRQTGDNGNWVSGYGVANANLTYQPSGKDWDIALGVYNLFDHQYDDPVGLDKTLAGSRAQIPQIGRSFRLKFTAHF